MASNIENFNPSCKFDPGSDPSPKPGTLDYFEAEMRKRRAAEEKPDADGLNGVQPTCSRDATIRAGEQALDELPTAAKEQIWDRWMQVAAALEAIRSEAMFIAQINEPDGSNVRYRRAHKDLIQRHRFDRIEKGTRSHLIECLRYRTEIDEWLAGLPINKRLKITHPLVILRNWRGQLPADHPAAKTSEVGEGTSPKQELKQAREKIQRLEHEINQGGGDLWNKDDRPTDIARVMIAKLAPSKAEKVAREILALIGKPKRKAVGGAS